jgi:hypothetical protein
MMAYDLDHPLQLDSCDRCAAPNWRECICDAARPYRQPTDVEIERARRSRLTRAELATGAENGDRL